MHYHITHYAASVQWIIIFHTTLHSWPKICTTLHMKKNNCARFCLQYLRCEWSTLTVLLFLRPSSLDILPASYSCFYFSFCPAPTLPTFLWSKEISLGCQVLAVFYRYGQYFGKNVIKDCSGRDLAMDFGRDCSRNSGQHSWEGLGQCYAILCHAVLGRMLSIAFAWVLLSQL